MRFWKIWRKTWRMRYSPFENNKGKPQESKEEEVLIQDRPYQPIYEAMEYHATTDCEKFHGRLR